MEIHPKFIVHWAGKNISRTLPLNSKQSDEYLELLRSIITKGLYMGVGTEVIHGRSKTSIQATIARVSFTEIKLSQVKLHTQKFGLLGIGYDRQFICERYGNPVFYVQNNRKYGAVIENLAHIGNYLNKKVQIGESEALIMKKRLEVVCSFLKNMSETDSQKFDYYDEMEWKIVHLNHMEESGIIVKRDNDYFLTFQPTDVKVIVFPDDQVKKNALEDTFLREELFDKHIPIITTALDCEHF